MEGFSFFTASLSEVMVSLVRLALRRYLFARLPHYEEHDIKVPEDHQDEGTLFWIGSWEIHLLADWITEHSEDGNIPAELCPLISELLQADDPNNSASITHLGPHGDPGMN